MTNSWRSLLVLFGKPPDHGSKLLETAKRLAKAGDHEVAVAAAQMACELFVEQAIIPLPPRGFFWK